MFFLSGYDAALYSAATSYYSQQQQGKTGGGPSWMLKKAATGNQFKPKPKGPPKAPQLHYCDVCKISCAGPQVITDVCNDLILILGLRKLCHNFVIILY